MTIVCTIYTSRNVSRGPEMLVNGPEMVVSGPEMVYSKSDMLITPAHT